MEQTLKKENIVSKDNSSDVAKKVINFPANFMTFKFKALKGLRFPTNIANKLAIFRKKSIVIPLIILVVIFSAGLYLTQHKSALFAAKVNNVLLLRSELTKLLTERYGASTLDEMITFSIVREELKKQNIDITDDMLNARLAEIESGLGGMKLEDVLKSQGQNIEDFKVQMRLELGAEEVLKDKVIVSEQEIKDFITKNGANLTAKDAEGQRAEALKIVRSQKMQQEVATWVSGLRSSAKIEKYL